MKKNLNFRKALGFALVVGAVGLHFSFGHSLNHLIHPKIARAFDGYTCYCPLLSGNQKCAVNNWGSQCAPDGTGQCSTYNTNCEG